MKPPTPLLCCLISLLFHPAAAGAADVDGGSNSRPNIVILLADDLGFHDVSYHGGDVKTPNIDRLAAEGTRLERFYVCPVCSPTRAGLMTGRWPLRYGLMRTVVPPWSKYGLPAGEHTIADLLKEAGYERRMIVGKWHLGHAAAKFHPQNRGFSHFYGHYNGAIDYFTHEREGEVDWHNGRDTVREEGYSTDLIGREAVRFIENSPKDKPFFLYVPFNAPHSPFQAKPGDIAKYPKMKKRRQTYAAMVDCMDQAVGRILRALDASGRVKDTFVLFFSDNGGVRNVADNSPLKGAKSTVYEGGTRVPAVVRWPNGGIGKGKIVNHRMGYIDVYPTLRRIIGKTGPTPKPLDGRDMLDVMRGIAEPADRDWFSFISMAAPEKIAVNTGTWKLVVAGPSVLDDSPKAKPTVELYRIDRDPNETTNLAGEHPDAVKELTGKLRKFRALKIDGVRPYAQGRIGFKAPKDWIIHK